MTGGGEEIGVALIPPFSADASLETIHRPPLPPDRGISISLEPISLQCSYNDARVLLRILNGWSTAPQSQAAPLKEPQKQASNETDGKARSSSDTRAAPETTAVDKSLPNHERSVAGHDGSEYELVFVGPKLGITLRRRDGPSSRDKSKHDQGGRRVKPPQQAARPGHDGKPTGPAVVDVVDEPTFISSVSLHERARMPQPGDTIVSVGGETVLRNS